LFNNELWKYYKSHRLKPGAKSSSKHGRKKRRIRARSGFDDPETWDSIRKENEEIMRENRELDRLYKTED
jgi:hypothetical protein